MNRHSEVSRAALLLRKFVAGPNRSVNAANELEAALRRLVPECFPEGEAVEDFADALAQYQPGGGEYLFDEVSILPKARHALHAITEGEGGELYIA